MNCKLYPINEDLAKTAWNCAHMDDYPQGYATQGYKELVEEAAEIAEKQKAKVDEVYHDKIDGLLDSFSRKLADNLNHKNSIDASCPSVLVAGPAGVNPRKKQKQLDRWESNWNEYNEIMKIKDKIQSVGTGGIRADEPNAIEKLKIKIKELEDKHALMKSANAYYRKHKTLTGCPGLSDKTVELLNKEGGKPFSTYSLSLNNAEIKRLKARLEQLEYTQNVGYVGWEFDGGHVEPNKEENRLQIFFDDIPDSDTRTLMKRNGFRWAPSQGAWQRQLNDNAIYAADRIEFLKPTSGVSVRELQKGVKG